MKEDFFGNLGKSISKAAKGLADNTGDLIETNKIKSEITAEEKTIEKEYRDIGAIMYQKYTNGMAVCEEVQELMNDISQRFQNIAQRNEEIVRLKGKKSCPTCGALAEMDAFFCPNCGCALPVNENMQMNENCSMDQAQTVAPVEPIISPVASAVPPVPPVVTPVPPVVTPVSPIVMPVAPELVPPVESPVAPTVSPVMNTEEFEEIKID